MQNQRRCEVCGYSSPLPKDLKRHEKTHGDIQDRPFECQECGKPYTRSDNLSRHQKKKHPSILDPSVSFGPPETQSLPGGQTAASENNSMASMLVQPDADLYQAEVRADPMHHSWYSGFGRGSDVGFEQMTGDVPTIDPQLLPLRNPFSRYEPLDFLRVAPAGYDDLWMTRP